jgi:hypothetical protein
MLSDELKAGLMLAGYTESNPTNTGLSWVMVKDHISIEYWYPRKDCWITTLTRNESAHILIDKVPEYLSENGDVKDG